MNTTTRLPFLLMAIIVTAFTFTASARASTPFSSIIADSVADFPLPDNSSSQSKQGLNNWYYGYHDFTVNGSYDATPGSTDEFIPFPDNQGPGSSPTDFWTGDQWDWYAGNPPWSEIGAEDMHPNSSRSSGNLPGARSEQWVIRRYVVEPTGDDEMVLDINWSLRKTDLFGTGVTGIVFHNGFAVDNISIQGNDEVGVTRPVRIIGVQAGDFIDFALSPEGPPGDRADANDGSSLTATVAVSDIDLIAQTLLPLGSTWKFLDNGSNQATAWRESEFDDAAWESGPAQLGYGDNDEATVVGFGGNANDKFATTYFRHTFTVDNVSQIEEVTAILLRDDAGAVYLNGIEVFRDESLPSGAAFDTFATVQGAENGTVNFNIESALLIEGENVLAVEIHQVGPDSSDISFDLRLTGIVNPIPEPGSLSILAIGLGTLLCRRRRRRAMA